MSQYSTDSLEETKEVSPRSQGSLHENSVRLNLSPIKATNDPSHDVPFHSKRTNPSLTRKQDTGSNETTSIIGTSKDTGTAGSRNAIIANGDTSKRRRPVSSKEGKRDVTDRLKRNNIDKPKQQEESIKKEVPPRRINRPSKTLSTKQPCCSKETSTSTKPNKNLSNVVAPRIQRTKESPSYLELHRRRFSGPWCNIRSPKGSTLSVWGDSHQEQLTDDETRWSATSGDDQSEPSFYRRLIEDPLAQTIRPSETVHQRDPEDTNILSSTLDEGVKQPSGDKSKKTVSYRPYTIEEYRTLSIPKLDRSLGPDKIEMQAKREWLTRRRSYGNSVSARNCQRILMQAQKIKLKDDDAEKCFLPPLKEQEVDAKTQDDSISSMISEDRETVSRYGRSSKRNRKSGRISSPRVSKKFDRVSSFCSPLYSRDFIEDSYLESLRQRHLYEKEMVDRIINQALCSRLQGKQLAA